MRTTRERDPCVSMWPCLPHDFSSACCPTHSRPVLPAAVRVIPSPPPPHAATPLSNLEVGVSRRSHIFCSGFSGFNFFCVRGRALGWAVGSPKKKSVHGKAVRPCATPTAHCRYDCASSNSSMKRANSVARAPRKACLREHASASYSTRSTQPCGQRTARKCRTKKRVVFTQMMVATFGLC